MVRRADTIEPICWLVGYDEEKRSFHLVEAGRVGEPNDGMQNVQIGHTLLALEAWKVHGTKAEAEARMHRITFGEIGLHQKP